MDLMQIVLNDYTKGYCRKIFLHYHAPAKIFKPKHNLPLLKNYRKPAPSEFWDNFPTNLVQPSKSMVDPYLLRKLDLETKFVDLVLLDTIHNDLLHGANLGCNGSSRLPSFSTNSPSAYEFAEHVTDAIADWTTKKFANGPVPLTHDDQNKTYRSRAHHSEPKFTCWQLRQRGH